MCKLRVSTQNSCHLSHHNVIQQATCIGFGEQVDSWEKRGIDYQDVAGIVSSLLTGFTRVSSTWYQTRPCGSMAERLTTKSSISGGCRFDPCLGQRYSRSASTGSGISFFFGFLLNSLQRS
ncbi:hypothetical protein ACQKWADRAFT_293693 [Trichoderma austrokoningii]